MRPSIVVGKIIELTFRSKFADYYSTAQSTSTKMSVATSEISQLTYQNKFADFAPGEQSKTMRAFGKLGDTIQRTYGKLRRSSIGMPRRTSPERHNSPRLRRPIVNLVDHAPRNNQLTIVPKEKNLC
jgi:hypothetical protein